MMASLEPLDAFSRFGCSIVAETSVRAVIVLEEFECILVARGPIPFVPLLVPFGIAKIRVFQALEFMMPQEDGLFMGSGDD